MLLLVAQPEHEDFLTSVLENEPPNQISKPLGLVTGSLPTHWFDWLLDDYIRSLL